MIEPTVPHSPELASHLRRLHELFDRVIDLPAGERDAEVARVSAEAPELGRDLRALLEHAARSVSPLDSAVVRLEGDSELPLPRIAGFRVDRCIGYGGSATVYLADQEHAEFTRKVALKVVDRPFDAGSLRSVREEQRILARLEHPGISRLYDAGMTAAGQHWLAMEYVRECRSWSTAMRGGGRSASGSSCSSRCFMRWRTPTRRGSCIATSSREHFRHREREPSAARLGSQAVGSDDQDETVTQRRALTPAYASPEQMRGDRTTTASTSISRRGPVRASGGCCLVSASR